MDYHELFAKGEVMLALILVLALAVIVMVIFLRMRQVDRINFQIMRMLEIFGSLTLPELVQRTGWGADELRPILQDLEDKKLIGRDYAWLDHQREEAFVYRLTRSGRIAVAPDA